MRPNIGRTILGGLAGTVAITLMMYFVSPMMGVKIDIAATLGKMLGGSWSLGMTMHFINGTIIFPLIYVFLLYRILPDQAWTKGVYWGLILWFLAQAAVMPMMGGGFFSANMGGMKAVIGSLLGHVVYGGLLGWIAGSATRRGAVQQFPEQRAA
jgi:uncharacterized membrane protein YagU involved in acid resistance